MENGKKKPEEKQADTIYLLLVFGAFIVAVMLLIGIYFGKDISVYVLPNSSATENAAAVSTAVVSDPAGELAASSEPENFLETESWVGAQEVLMAKSIDINRADSETLEKLPGIGPVLAGRIIEYRRSYGEFSDIEEIMEVSGIGEKIFAKIRDFIFAS